MHPSYHDALVAAAVAAVVERARADGWSDVTVSREGTMVFVTLLGAERGDNYLAKIDMTRFPVEPYEVGFIKPVTEGPDRHRVSDRDPRYWPWSPMPALTGNFNLHFQGALRVFWCRDCTASYFYYHGHQPGEQWRPARWPLERVIAHLRAAAQLAIHPARWRPVQRAIIAQHAAQRGAALPEHGGVGDA